MNKKTHQNRFRSGFTLAELLIAILILSLFSTTAVTVITVSAHSSYAFITASESDIVCDTINTILRDVLMYSENLSQSDGSLRFCCPKYTGLDMSLYCDSGRILALIYLTDGSEKCEKYGILQDAAYAGFEVSDFTICYEEGIFQIEYTIGKTETEFERKCSLSVAALNR